jgi:hypothetical protein
MNHKDNLLDVVEMILAESQRDLDRDVYLVPAWMMRDLRVALGPFVQPVASVQPSAVPCDHSTPDGDCPNCGPDGEPHPDAPPRQYWPKNYRPK